ncbi:VirB4 family type IV secretion system protein, partial [Nitrolancea hollandica]|uniref:VirB4 family type IV secretion system protein n=1 Tax=Nitrolancea hollandica TaxID=1206749 RepID=UPI0012674ED2
MSLIRFGRQPRTPDEQRLAQGTRSAADLVAPAAVELARDHLRLDAQYARTLVVTGYPRTVSPGWLTPLVDFEEPIELSLHIHPLETGPMVSALSHKLVQLHSSRLLAARNGRLADPEREVAYEDAERLRDALQRGDEKVFSVSLYLLLRAPSSDALETLTRRVEVTLAGMLAQARIAILEQDTGFRSCLPAGRDLLAVSRNLDTSSLATMFPFASSTLAMERGVLYGIAKHNHSPVIVDPFDPSLENANLVVFAQSGAGKSYFTKLMALRNLLAGVDFLVIDPEDEYGPLCDAVEGQAVRLASSSEQQLNPFDLPPAGDGDVDPLAEQVTRLLGLLELLLAEPGHPLSIDERAVLDRALYQTYADAGITADPTSH